MEVRTDERIQRGRGEFLGPSDRVGKKEWPKKDNPTTTTTTTTTAKNTKEIWKLND